MAKKYHSIKGKSALPLPSKPTFKQNEKVKEAVNFFEYWSALSPELASMARVRCYRMKPPIDLTKIGEKVKSIQVWEGPIPFAPDDWEKEFYEAPWGGGGDYRCQIEEIGLGGVVCDAFFSLPDWDRFPPKVPDAALMLESNGGKEYVAWRARRGDPVQGAPVESNELEDFMQVGTATASAASAVTTMAEGMVKMAERAIDNAGKNNSPDLPQQQPDMMTHAASESIKLIADTSREMMKNSNAPDPVEMVKAVIGLLPPPVVPVDPSPMFNTILGVVQESNKTMMTMVMSQNAELKSELQRLREGSHAAPAKTVREQLQEMKESAELLGYSRGAGGEVAATAAPSKSVMEEWGPIIQMGMTIIGPLATALVAKLSAPPAGAAPAAQPAPATVQQVQTPQSPPQPPNPALMFLEKIEKPFLSHLLSTDCDGYTFAAHILSDGNGGQENLAGRAQYNQIKANLGIKPDGTCGLDKLIQQYDPIWQLAKGDKPAYQEFLRQFFSYDDAVGAPAGVKPS